MAKINQIILNNFRNFQNLNIFFNERVNIFFGDNGSGKTNILESISLISKGRGIRNAKILDMIKKNEKNFFIKSILEINGSNLDIEIVLDQSNNNQKKTININNDNSSEARNFLNKSVSYLYFLPEMERLFQSSPSYRRNFIDRLIFSYNNNYNTLINKYKKNIIERNKILQNYQIDTQWINYIEDEISNIGLTIYELRKIQLEILNDNIEILSHSNDYKYKVKFQMEDEFFTSTLTKESYMANLFDNRDFDKKFGGSKIGPHKSDIIAIINNNFNGSQLSTGQQKTIVLMCLLSQCNYLINNKKMSPILLLDEICSHLDVDNRKILSDIINNFDIQLFLTGTEKTLFSFISTNVNFYNITEI